MQRLSISEQKEQPQTILELTEFLLELCQKKLTEANPAVSIATLNEHISQQFAILRLQATYEENSAWYQLSHASTTLSFDSLSAQENFSTHSANFCNTLIERCQNEITPAAERHWSVGFLKNHYQKRIMERFVELEKRQSISWLAPQVNAQKKVLKALHALPDAAEAFLEKINNTERESKEADQGRKISLVETLLKRTRGENAGIIQKSRDEIIRQILIDIDINISLDNIKNFNDLYEIFEILWSTSNEHTLEEKQSDDSQKAFIETIIRPFSIQEFLYDTITKPFAELSNTINSTASLASHVAEASSTSSLIDRVVHCGQFISEASDYFDSTRSIASGIQLIANNANNELRMFYNGITYLFPSLNTEHTQHLLYKIVLQNSPEEVEKYKKFLNPNLNSLLGVYFFLENYRPENKPLIFEDIKKVFTLEIDYKEFEFLCTTTVKNFNPIINLSIPDLLNRIKTTKPDDLPQKFNAYTLLLYKLHLLEKAFLNTSTKNPQQKIALLNDLKLIINDAEIPVELRDNCTAQYKKLFFILYTDHYKSFIEELIDTGAKECKLEDDKAVAFNAELSEFYTHLESGNNSRYTVSVLEEDSASHPILANLKAFYDEYQDFSKNSSPTPLVKTKKTPRQEMQQLIDPPFKNMMILLTQSAIHFLKTMHLYSPEIIQASSQAENYSNALKGRKNYINALLSTLYGLQLFIQTDQRCTELIAAIINNQFPIPDITQDVLFKNVMSWILEFGPNNSSQEEEISLPKKFLAYCITSYLPTNLQALHSCQAKYKKSIDFIYKQHPELFFALTDPLTTNVANTEALANSVTEQIYAQFNISEHAQQTLQSVLNASVTVVGSMTPVGFIANEIINSKILQHHLAQVCPNSLSSTASQISNEAKAQILQTIGITVKEKLTVSIVKICFDKFNQSDNKEDETAKLDDQSQIFINFLAKIYALVPFTNTNDNDLKKIIREILLAEGINSTDIISSTDSLVNSFKIFHQKHIKEYAIYSAPINEVAQRVEITNPFQLSLLRNRIEAYFKASEQLSANEKNLLLPKIHATFAILKDRMQEEPALNLYTTIFGNMNKIIYASEKQQLANSIDTLNSEIRKAKTALQNDLTIIENDKGPIGNWIQEIKKAWLIPVIKLIAKTTPFISAAHTLVICSSNFKDILPLIGSLQTGAVPLLPIFKYAVFGLSSASTLGLLTIGLITVSFISNAAYELYLSRKNWMRNDDGGVSHFSPSLYSLPRGLFLPLIKAAAITIFPYAPAYAVYKVARSSASVFLDTYKSLKYICLGKKYRNKEKILLKENQDQLKELDAATPVNVLDEKIKSLPIYNKTLATATEPVKNSIARIKGLEEQTPSSSTPPLVPATTTVIMASLKEKKSPAMPKKQPKNSQQTQPRPSLTFYTSEDIKQALKTRAETLDSLAYQAKNVAATAAEAAVTYPLLTTLGTGLIAALSFLATAYVSSESPREKNNANRLGSSQSSSPASRSPKR